MITLEGPQKLPCTLSEVGSGYVGTNNCTAYQIPQRQIKGWGLAKGQRVVVCAHARRNLDQNKMHKFFTGSTIAAFERAGTTKPVAK